MDNTTTSSAPTGGGAGNNNNVVGLPGNRRASSAQHQTNANRLSGAASTITITETETRTENEEVLRLTLRARPSVTWEEGVVDNEGLGRKSSKRCCIFHKQRAFGESSTDSSDNSDSDGSSSSGGPGGDSSGRSGKIARKKPGTLKTKKVPDYQRFHA